MNFILLPSLLDAATVRTALLLYNDQEMDTILTRDTDEICLTCKKREAWELVEKNIVEKLSSLLPVTVQQRVAKVFRPMHYEVHKWKADHKFLVEHVSACCSVYLTWKTDGTINRIGTAKKIVLDDSIDLDIRFILACTYFFEDEIVTLWKRIKDSKTFKIFQKADEKRITRKGTNSAVRFWLESLQTKNTTPSIEMIDEYFRSPSSTPLDIPLRVSSFIQFLSWETKQNYFVLFDTGGIVHSDDFQACVNKMDQSERIQVFRSEYTRALSFCLQWPFRSVFLKMAKESFSSLTPFSFGCVVLDLITSYVFDGEQDFHLLEEFWQMSPDAFKDELMKIERFRKVKKYMLGFDHVSEYLKNFVRKHFLD